MKSAPFPEEQLTVGGCCEEYVHVESTVIGRFPSTSGCPLPLHIGSTNWMWITIRKKEDRGIEGKKERDRKAEREKNGERGKQELRNQEIKIK